MSSESKGLGRRRLLLATALAAPVAAQTTLPDERMRVLKPVLDARRTQLQALRQFDVDDRVEPTHGRV